MSEPVRDEQAATDGLEAVAWPLLSQSEIDEVAPFGVEREVGSGEMLFVAGDPTDEFFVVLEGEVEVVGPDRAEQGPLVRIGPRGFVGELSLLTGQRRFVAGRMSQAGRVLAVGQDGFRRLMSIRPALAETLFRAFVARREILRKGPGAEAIRIVGSRYSPEAMSLRSFAEHSRLVHTWIDVEDAPDVKALLDSLGLRSQDLPAVLTPNGTLRHATAASFAEQLGLTFQPVPGYIFDLVVVGSGPAGLAAAVYGASEGLSTVCLDAVAVGGQAGSSSRIENYAGFPNGISGGDLTARTAAQALRLGARMNAPCAVVGLRPEGTFHVVALKDGSEIPTRAVIVASGAKYRRLDAKDLERFEGTGVYYAATDLEARMCRGAPVLVVGGGNSAGQAAIYLGQNECAVKIAIRRDDLAATMSQYLIERIEAAPNIELLTRVEVAELDGAERLEQVVLRSVGADDRLSVPASALFCFIGADPATSWLDGTVQLDDHGFVLTDRRVGDSAATGDGPLPFETSAPGVFAAGDVRSGSMKRVAAAVGEGSSAVRSVHERLATYAKG